MYMILHLVLLYHANAICKWDDSFQRGRYYVIGLYQLYTDSDWSEFDENAIRLHLKIRYFLENQYYRNNRAPLGYLSFNVCNASMMTAQLMHISLNPYFKPKQKKFQTQANCSNCYENNQLADFCNCKVCKCSDSYSSNILVILSYLPIQLAKLATELMAGDNIIPFFAFFLNEELYLPTNWNDRNYPIYSTYILGKFYLMDNLKSSGIKHLAIVEIGNFSSDLALYHQNKLWTQIVENREICIQKKFIDPSDTSEMKSYVDYIRNDKSLQLITIWTDYNNIQRFIELTNNITDRVWYWYTNHPDFMSINIYNLDYESQRTHIYFRHPVFSYEWLNRKFLYTDMSRYMYRESFNDILTDKWISTYITKKQLDKTDINVFKSFDNKTTLESIYVESLVNLLWWTYPTVDGRSIEIIRDWLRYSASILTNNLAISKTGKYFMRTTGNVKLKAPHVNKHNICVVIKCYPGYEPKYETYYDTREQLKRVNWHCVDCPNGMVKSGFSEEYCHKCRDDMKSNMNRSSCYDPYIELYLQPNDEAIITVITVATCGVIFNVVTIFVFIKFKSTPIIRASGLDASLLQLFTHLLLFIALPINFLNQLTQVKCILQPIFIGSFLSIITTITMTKTVKSLNAFNATLVLSKRAIFITKTVEWFVLLLVVIIQMTICGISFYQVLPTLHATLNKMELTRDVYCTNNFHLQVQLGYVLLLSLFCLIQAFRGRKLPGRFNESTRTTYSMLITILILMGVTFPIAISQSKSKDRVVIIIISVTFINTIQLLFMHSYRVFLVIFRAEKNTKSAFQSSMMRHAQENSSRVLQSGSTSQPL